MKKGDTSPFSILIGGAIAVVILIVVVLLVMKGAKTGDTTSSCSILGATCKASCATDGTELTIPNRGCPEDKARTQDVTCCKPVAAS